MIAGVMKMREEKSSRDKSMKRFFKKRWVYPTAYLASAAIILTGVLWYQSADEGKVDQATDMPGRQINEQPAIEVNRSFENFVMPIADVDSSVIKMQFYDNDSDKAEQEAALVVYNNQYHPSTGIDIASKNGKEFDVIASLSGDVVSVKEDSLLGNVVEIEHDNGIVTQYQSIKNIKVKEGDTVEQGEKIAASGTSLYNEKAGVHVHFEIRKDGVPVNPLDYFNKPLSALEEQKMKEDSGKEETDSEGTPTEEGTPAEEGTPTEDGTPSEEGDDTEEDGSSKEETESDKETSTDEKPESTEETDPTQS